MKTIIAALLVLAQDHLAEFVVPGQEDDVVAQERERTLTVLEGQWEAAEQGVFQEALRALAQTRPTQLAPERIRYGEPAAGPE